MVEFKFSKWLKLKETDAIYDGTKGVDFQWWGCPEKYKKKVKKNELGRRIKKS